MNRLITAITVIFLTGCSSLTYVKNEKIDENKIKNEELYLAKNMVNKNQRSNDITLILTFSGGGVRSSALSYGILEKLRNTTIFIDGKERRLLDEVDAISSVSGGSFTSAYYGLHGEAFFDKYKEAFLYRSTTDDLISAFFRPFNFFSNKRTTDVTLDYYRDKIFGDATFKDIKRDGPFIIINSTDITTNARFSFTQEYFNLICSDINDFPISNAVLASSAVPILFDPIVLENYNDCTEKNAFVLHENKNFSLLTNETISELNSFKDTEKNRYIHLVDGGITDNLGLLAVYDFMQIKQNQLLTKNKKNIDNHKVIIISVDAATNPDSNIGQDYKEPSVEDTLNKITDISLHRYNNATKDLINESLKKWKKSYNNGDNNIETYFIDISFEKIPNKKNKFLFNQIRTDLSLDKETVDLLIKEGHEQLDRNDQFKEVVSSLRIE